MRHTYLSVISTAEEGMKVQHRGVRCDSKNNQTRFKFYLRAVDGYLIDLHNSHLPYLIILVSFYLIYVKYSCERGLLKYSCSDVEPVATSVTTATN